ncbi:MAG: hypothetical protein RR321_07595 [Acidaminococcaceae bacterium]
MKKFTTLCLTVMTLIAFSSTAFASQSKWKNPNYDFTKLRNVQVSDIFLDSEQSKAVTNTNQPTAPSTAQGQVVIINQPQSSNQIQPDRPYTDDAGALQKVDFAIRSALAKYKLGYLTQPSVTTTDELPLSNHTLERAQLAIAPRIFVTVYALGSAARWQEGWTEVRTVNRKIERTDNYGRRETFWIPDKEYIQHPAHYNWTAYADLEFTLKAPDSDTVLYTVRDNRDRGGETDTAGMLKRICEDFAKEITRNK